MFPVAIFTAGLAQGAKGWVAGIERQAQDLQTSVFLLALKHVSSHWRDPTSICPGLTTRVIPRRSRADSEHGASSHAPLVLSRQKARSWPCKRRRLEHSWRSGESAFSSWVFGFLSLLRNASCSGGAAGVWGPLASDPDDSLNA